jgi:hypothetical protein
VPNRHLEIAEIGANFLCPKPIGGELPMWKTPAPVLWLAALPLLGCAGNYTAPQAAAVTPTPVAATAPYYYAAAAPQVYTAGPAAPAAILVFLPGADVVASDPALWEAQGFDVVMPQPTDIYRLVADQEAAMARLIASAEATANAPIWLVGPSQVIETAIPQAGDRVSGIIVTSAGSPTFSCSESFSYYNSGTGAPPQVKVSRSGNCGPAGMPAITERQPSAVAPAPAPRSNASPLIETRSKGLPQAAPQRHQPRIIEASAAGKNLPPAAQVHRLAQLIKTVPPS